MVPEAKNEPNRFGSIPIVPIWDCRVKDSILCMILARPGSNFVQHGSESNRNREPGTGKTEANRIGEPVKGCEPANRLNSELAEPRTGMPGYQDATFLKVTFFSRIGSS